MADPATRPIDRVVGGYLALSAVALLFPDRPDAWPLLLVLHLGLGAALLTGSLDRLRNALGGGTEDGAGRHHRTRRAAAILLDFYPLLLAPAIYLEIQLLNTAVWDGHYFDATIMRWEEALFGGQPSVTLALRWDSLVVSEVLHTAYLAFFPMLYLFPVALYAAGRHGAFHRTLFALVLTFAVHYLVFVYFPVQGPRYLFPGPAGAPTEGPVYGLTRTILATGSSQGAAFPSSHVGLAAVQTGNAIRFAPAVAPLFGLLTLGIAAGAVYGGFHYGVDAAAGLVLGLGLAAAAPSIRRRLQ